MTITQEKMTPMITVHAAWQLLHQEVPRLFPNANFNYRGKLRPGQTIQADITRETVEVAVRFQICHKGEIRFIHEFSPTMVTWAEIHAHFLNIDRRIPPYGCCVEEENRLYYPNGMFKFKLAEGVEVPNAWGEDGRVPGGTNANGQVLPPVVFPKPEIYITGDMKVQGSLKWIPGPLDSAGEEEEDSDTETDSDEDVDEYDTHKLRELGHAARLKQPITVGIRGQYHDENRLEEVLFEKEFCGVPAPGHILEPQQLASEVWIS
jgi:hypothetical protein